MAHSSEKRWADVGYTASKINQKLLHLKVITFNSYKP